MEARNCRNHKNLSELARAVTHYSQDIVEEHREKRAGKVLGLGDLRLYECPLSYITQDTRDVVRLVFLADSSGHLLYDGGWAGQPAWFVEAYETFRIESAKHLKGKTDGR